VADSHHEMLAKHWQNKLMMVKVNDTEYAADAPMPTGKECSQAALAHCHHPWTTHLLAITI